MKSRVVFFLFCVNVSLCKATFCSDIECTEQNMSKQCCDQLKIICNNTVILSMLDATSKFPMTGLGYASKYDYGNFDECINIDYKEGNERVLGKHCAFSVLVNIPNNVRTELTNPYPETYQYPQNKLFTSSRADFYIPISACVPDQCTVEEFVSLYYTNGTKYRQDESFCSTKETYSTLEGGDIAFIIFFAVTSFLIIGNTTYDVYLFMNELKPKKPYYVAFSVLSNGRKLIHIQKSTSEQIQCLNGMRFISMMWVIAGHGFVPWPSIGVTNAVDIDQWKSNLYAQYIMAGPIAVDTFFFISGLLLSFGYLKKEKPDTMKQQLLNVPKMYIHRYLRLTPAIAILYFGFVTVYKFLGSGPLWKHIVSDNNRICTKYWYSFFLYFQNYHNYKEMCLFHTWYLSADMQMFILAPIVFIPVSLLIRRNYRIVIGGLCALIVACVIFPMAIRFADHTIDNVYDSHSRFCDYLIGFTLGAVLRETKDKPYAFSKVWNMVLWCVVLIGSMAMILLMHGVLINYEHTSDTLFYGFYRPCWCTALAFMVYSCYHGYGGIVNWILTTPVVQVGGRLSYCMYLLHGAVIIYAFAIVRTNLYFNDYVAFYYWCGHFIVTMVLAVFWTLAFESPIIILEKLLFK